jgi:hypothetical protein
MTMLKIALAALMISPLAAGAAGPGTEYKVLVDTRSVETAKAAYGLSAAGKKENVYFFDTSGFDYYSRGTLLRGRASGKKGDTTVKMRPAPAHIPPEIESDPGFRCEYDRGMNGSVYSCSLKGKETGPDVEAAAAGTTGLESIFSGNRGIWLGNVSWREMSAYGPVRAESWKQDHPALGELAFESWTVPGGTYFFEISFRSEADTVGRNIRLFHDELTSLGIVLAPSQVSKTAAAFRAFGAQASGRLRVP